MKGVGWEEGREEKNPPCRVHPDVYMSRQVDFRRQ